MQRLLMIEVDCDELTCEKCVKLLRPAPMWCRLFEQYLDHTRYGVVIRCTACIVAESRAKKAIHVD